MMTSEKVAYWFFRLNGCFTFENFIIHPDARGSQHTDADVIAARFKHRIELYTSDNPMEDHALFSAPRKLVNVFLVEAKAGVCELNGPWTKPEKQNLQRLLYAMGFVPPNIVNEVAKQLYEQFCYTNDSVDVRFVAVGRERSKRIRSPEVLQLTWVEVLEWIHLRFTEHEDQKADHPQWDTSGKKLFRSAVMEFPKDRLGFIAQWLGTIGVATQESSTGANR